MGWSVVCVWGNKNQEIGKIGSRQTGMHQRWKDVQELGRIMVQSQETIFLARQVGMPASFSFAGCGSRRTSLCVCSGERITARSKAPL